MKNFEKYKTAAERDAAFNMFCTVKKCNNCEIGNSSGSINCAFTWLDLEAEEEEEEEEKPLPCPFCGSKCEWDGKVFKCTDCQYRSSGALRKESAIAAHNRVAKAVMEAKESKVK